MRLGIVATVRDPPPWFRDWFDHHRRIGFERFFVFVDDTELGWLEELEGDDVTFCVRSHELEKRWRQTELFRRSRLIRRTIDAELMTRLALNATLGIQLANDDGVDWLLHLDADEVFLPPADQHLADYFASFEQPVMWFPNHEAVPTTTEHINPLREITDFRRNQMCTASDAPADSRFRFYGNGKSGLRVDPRFVAPSSHTFVHCTSLHRESPLRVEQLEGAPAQLLALRLERHARRVLGREKPVARNVGESTLGGILHYPLWSLSELTQHSGRRHIGSSPKPLYYDLLPMEDFKSRLKTAMMDGDDEAIDRLYASSVLSPDRRQSLHRSGHLLSISDVADGLGR